jgi:hypothetical protein
MGLHRMGVCLMGVYLTGVYLMDVYLRNVYLIGVYLMACASWRVPRGRVPHGRVPHRRASRDAAGFTLSYGRIYGFWWSLAWYCISHFGAKSYLANSDLDKSATIVRWSLEVMRCTPVRCTSMRYTPMICTSMRYTPWDTPVRWSFLSILERVLLEIVRTTNSLSRTLSFGRDSFSTILSSATPSSPPPSSPPSPRRCSGISRFCYM